MTEIRTVRVEELPVVAAQTSSIFTGIRLPDGFAAYRRRIEPPGWRGSIDVVLLLALNPPAYRALWRYCLDIDLMDEVSARGRSADEPHGDGRRVLLLSNPAVPEAIRRRKDVIPAREGVIRRREHVITPATDP